MEYEEDGFSKVGQGGELNFVRARVCVCVCVCVSVCVPLSCDLLSTAKRHINPQQDCWLLSDRSEDCMPTTFVIILNF